MIFETSGSTGTPKRVTHVSALLRREAAYFLTRLRRPSRVVRFVPPQHLYGYIFSVLLPELAGVPIFDARTFYNGYRPARFAPDDLIVAAPHQWRWLFNRGTVFPSSVQGVSSTSPCPADLFGHVQLIDVYGSTETSGVGYRFHSDHPYELLPWWRRGDPAIEQNDFIRWVDNHHFFVEGRRDGAVQISGVNIFPSVIESRLRLLPGVADCVVRLMHPTQGRRLKAFLIPHPGADLDSLQRRIALEFTGPEELAVIHFGAEIPLPTDW